MEFEGMIVQYLGRQTGTSKAGRPWQKDEYVCETPGTYPRKVKFHIFGDKADQLKFENGKSYVLSCDIESREFNGRWYTDVSVFSARPVENGQGMAAPAPGYGAPAPAPEYGAPAQPAGSGPDSVRGSGRQPVGRPAFLSQRSEVIVTSDKVI